MYLRYVSCSLFMFILISETTIINANIISSPNFQLFQDSGVGYVARFIFPPHTHLHVSLMQLLVGMYKIIISDCSRSNFHVNPCILLCLGLCSQICSDSSDVDSLPPYTHVNVPPPPSPRLFQAPLGREYNTPNVSLRIV